MGDLRILFAPAADTGYRAQLADAKGRRLGVEVPFTPFLTEDDYEDLRWYLEEYMDLPDGGAVLRAERIERNLEDWGRRLYKALFTATDNREFLQELLKGQESRRLTVATRDPSLLRLPWELMADEAGSLAQRLSVRRQLEVAEETTPRPVRLPLRILYIVSRPAAGFIDPRLTAKALLDAIDPLGANVRVDFLPSAHPGAHGGDAACPARGRRSIRYRSLRRPRHLSEKGAGRCALLRKACRCLRRLRDRLRLGHRSRRSSGAPCHPACHPRGVP